MGTIERGESNLSFQNIVKVATTLGVSLSSLFRGLEARIPAYSSEGTPAKTRKRGKRS